MAAIQPQTIADSLFRRIEDARYMKKLTPMFINRLLSDIEKLKLIAPDLAWSMEGSVYALANQESKAIFACQKSIELNHSASNIYNLGFTYEIFNQFELALDCYRQAFQIARNGDIKILRTLEGRLMNFFAYDDLTPIKTELDKCKIKHNIDIITKLNKVFGSGRLMLDFGLEVNRLINQHIVSRFIIGTEFREIDERLHIVNLVQYVDDEDLEKIVECNAHLSDLFAEFAEKNHLDLDCFYLYCEAYK